MKILDILAGIGVITIVSKVVKIALALDRDRKNKKEES